MIINIADYRKKVLGCWMGKNIGGTLGAPMEWKRQLNDVSFYQQELDGEPLPNDDLDIQLLWLIALETCGIHIDAHILSEYWLNFLTPTWVEYGTSKAYLRAGLMPPLCSIPNNPFKNSCGAFIRSEIWACISPGAPDIAAKYAYEDSIIDHGTGEGIYAEMFCAALQSAAFVESDMYKLIDIGLSYIPEDCGVAQAVKTTLECHQHGNDWLECRDEILRRHRGHYLLFASISDRDREMGFEDGKMGYDAPANIAFMILGWIYGENDFGKSLCLAVNCGEDTDCTAATLGAILGIINGIDHIPEKWIAPIGRKIKTIALNAGDLRNLPEDIDNLSMRVEKFAKTVLLTWKPKIELSETKPTSISEEDKQILRSNGIHEKILSNLHGPTYRFSECDFQLEYPDGPFIQEGASVKIVIKPIPHFHPQTILNIKWYHDNENFTISPAANSSIFSGSLGVGTPSRLEYTITATGTVSKINRFAIEMTVDSRHTVMLIPVVLLSGHLC